MADIRNKILATRKPAAQLGGVHDDYSKGVEGGSISLVDESISPEGNSSFGICSKTTSCKGVNKGNLSVRWADDLLRGTAGRNTRVALAVRDAARCAEAKGLSPMDDAIYVASSIREGWKLSTDQLSKGLKALEGRGAIRFTSRRRGRHARFLLTPSAN